MLRLADDADVVLRVAGDGAGAAADAPVEVHHHGPAVVVVVVRGVEIALGAVAFGQRQGEREIVHGQPAAPGRPAGLELGGRDREQDGAPVLDATAVGVRERPRSHALQLDARQHRGRPAAGRGRGRRQQRQGVGPAAAGVAPVGRVAVARAQHQDPRPDDLGQIGRRLEAPCRRNARARGPPGRSLCPGRCPGASGSGSARRRA